MTSTTDVLNKYCTHCKLTKSIDDYYQHIRKCNGKLKLSSYCKKCEGIKRATKIRKSYNKTCNNCKKNYVTNRSHSCFCSENCYSANYNKTHKFELTLLRIERVIKNSKLEKYCKKWTQKEHLIATDLKLSPQTVAKKLNRPISSVYCYRSRFRKILNSKLGNNINYTDAFRDY